MKKNILVIFGGCSPEYIVSCDTAASAIEAISKAKYNVFCLGITQDGEWILTNASNKEISDAKSWLERSDNRKAILSPDRSKRGIIVFEQDKYSFQSIDCIFPLVHGETGEDGKLQGLFELAGIPYVGSGVCASACSMDKTVTMRFAQECQITCPVNYGCNYKDVVNDVKKVKQEIIDFFSAKLDNVFPVYVKPASTGSSIGITRVSTEDQLEEALLLAASYKGNIIVEENIVGRELKVAVLGNKEAKTGAICEIKLNNCFYNSFLMKYNSNSSHKIIPAEIDDRKAMEICEKAKAIYNKLDCRGFARVDFFMKEDGEVVFNEINTVPGFSNKSIFTTMFNAVGYTYERIVQELIDSAMEELS